MSAKAKAKSQSPVQTRKWSLFWVELRSHTTKRATFLLMGLRPALAVVFFMNWVTEHVWRFWTLILWLIGPCTSMASHLMAKVWNMCFTMIITIGHLKKGLLERSACQWVTCMKKTGIWYKPLTIFKASKGFSAGSLSATEHPREKWLLPWPFTSVLGVDVWHMAWALIVPTPFYDSCQTNLCFFGSALVICNRTYKKNEKWLRGQKTKEYIFKLYYYPKCEKNES